MSPDLCVTSAKPVRLLKNGKVKRVKRKPNSLTALSAVSDFVYPGGNKKLAKDATTDPFSRKKRKVKAKKRKANPRTSNYLVEVKQNQNSGWKVDSVHSTLEAAKKRRDSFSGYAYEARIRPTNRKPNPYRKPAKRKANRKPAKRKVNRKPRKRTVKSKSNRKRRSSR